MREILFYILLPISVLIVLQRPFAGAMIYVGINVIRPEMLFWGGNQGDIAYKTIIAATLVSLLRVCPSEFFASLRTREILLLFAMWVSALISLALSPFPAAPQAMYYVTEILKLALLASVVLAVLDSRERVELVEKILLLLFSLLALWGIEQHLRGNERLEGFALGDSNDLAALLVLMLPLGLSMALHASDKKYRRLGLLAVVLIVLAIVSTQSRGGFLGASVASAAFFLYSHRKTLLIVLVALMVMLVLSFAPETYFHRLSTIKADESEIDPSAGSRLVLWRAGLMVFRDNPLTGVGFLSFPRAKMEYKHQVEGDERLIEYSFSELKVSHNTYIQILSEGGLILAIPFFLLLKGLYFGNWRVRRFLRDSKDDPLLHLLNGIEAGITGYCVCIIFINAITAVFLPLQIVISRRIRDELYGEEAVAAGAERRPLDESTVPGV